MSIADRDQRVGWTGIAADIVGVTHQGRALNGNKSYQQGFYLLTCAIR